MSFLMGLTMSFCLSLLGTLLSGHFTLVTWLISFAASFVVSIVIGLLVPMKKVNDSLISKMNLQEGSIKAKTITALASDIIYTPIICILMVSLGVVMAGKGMDAQIVSMAEEKTSLTAQMEAKQTELTELTAQYDAKKVEYQTLLTTIDIKKEALEAANKNNSIPEAKQLEGQIEEMNTGEKELAAALDSMEEGKVSLQGAIDEMQNGINDISKGIENISNNKPTILTSFLHSFPVSFIGGFILVFLLSPIYMNLVFKKYGILD